MLTLSNTLETYRKRKKHDFLITILMTTWFLQGDAGSFRIRFRNGQSSPHSVWRGKELSPAAKLHFLSERTSQQYSKFPAQCPTCLYEDPSWYISTPLGYNLGGQKKPLWNKYNTTKHTHSRSKKENKSRIHAEARDWSCNSHGQGNNLPLGLLCFKKKKKENEKRLQASSYTLRDADLLFYCCFSAVS